MKKFLSGLISALLLITAQAHAQTTITQLPNGGLMQQTDLVPMVRAGVTMKAQPYVWPSVNNVMVSTGTSAPQGVAEVDGSCLFGSGGIWTTATCGTGSGGSSGQILYNNSGAQGGFTMIGDCSLNTGTGTITCLKSNGVAFGPAAFVANLQGNGSKVQAATGSTTTGHCGKYDASGNWIDAGIACNIYDLSQFYPAKPANSALISRIVLLHPVTFPSNFAGGYCSAVTAATSSTVLTIADNGTPVGTATWASSGTTCTFSTSGAVTFAAGDIFTITNQSSADSTLAAISISITGTRN